MTRVPAEALTIKLPPGFYFEEDEDSLCLFFTGHIQVAVFSSTRVDPQEIKRVALAFAKKHSLPTQ